MSTLFSRRALAAITTFLISLSIAQAQSQPGQYVLRHSENQVALGSISRDYSTQYAKDKSEAIVFALANGLPIRQEFSGGKLIEIQALRNGIPVYYHTSNMNGILTNGVNLCWPSGSLGLNLTGKGINLGVWDGGGVRTSHREFAGRVTQKDIPVALHDHSTHVTGTMIASGVMKAATGASYEGTADAYDWNDDLAEMALAASQGLRTSNHSYALGMGWVSQTGQWAGDPSISMVEDYGFGFYTDWARAYDEIAFSAPNYLIVWAAGNDRGEGPNPTIPGWPPRDGGETGYDCIPGDGCISKNTLTVGAVKAIPAGYVSASSVEMSSFSSWGPADDGRIKPDIVADGVNVFSCLSTGDSEYGSMSGTSMAAPSTTGAMGLITQHYKNLRLTDPTSAMMKALVIHTAREAGPNPGPDYMFGWGLLSASNAVQTITKASTGRAMIYEGTLAANGIYMVELLSTGSEPLKATLVWTDPPGTPPQPSLDPATKMLVNNLELSISEGTNVYLPWCLDAAHPEAAATRRVNNTDNVEQVVVDAPGTKYHQIAVFHAGTLTGGSQNFALVITGISPNQWNLNVKTSLGDTTPVEMSGTHPGTTPYTTAVAEGSLVEIWAPEQVGDLYFRRWKASNGSSLGSVPKLSFILERETTVEAEYGTVPTGYSLLAVQSEPISGVQITGTYPGATNYSVEASERDLTTLRAPVVVDNYVFVRWKTPDGVTLSEQPTYQFLLNEARTVIAEYASVATSGYQFIIESDGLTQVPIGGTFTASTVFSRPVRENDLVTVIAPSQYLGWFFRRWKSSNGVTLSGNPVYCTAIRGNTTLVAEYDDEAPAKAVRTWGHNEFGQLGINVNYGRNFPVTPSMGNSVAVAAGHYHSLAIDSNARVYAWGRNTRGQLGLGTTTDTYITPQLVPNLTNVIDIAAGARHSLAVVSDGSVWAWGSSSAGQIGDGELIDRISPIQVEGITDAVQVSGGMYHSLALLRDGTVWAWGSNVDGQLGDGTFDSSVTPIQVNAVSGVARIAAGANHNVALTAGGKVWTWGNNSWGQIGNNSLIGQTVPIEIAGLSNIIDIAAGETHSLALAEDGTVYAWGANWWGQLGDMTDMTRKYPIVVVPASGKTPVDVEAGSYHSAARMSDGTAYAWGWNRNGQLGDGSYTDRHTGSRIITLNNVVSLAPGGSHTVALADEGSAPPVPTDAEWTIMIYMDSDNNLEAFALADFSELALVGSDQNRNIIVMMDAYNGASMPGGWTGARRGRVLINDVPDNNWGTSIGEVNMGDPNTLAGFISWAQLNYSAQNYALILWDHGDGWRPSTSSLTSLVDSGFKPSWICDDITSGDQLTLMELEQALDTASADPDYVTPAIIGLDADRMGMLEIAAALEGQADILIASEDDIPGASWPYTAIMEFMEDNAAVNPESLAIEIVSKYRDYYALAGSNVTLSAIDLNLVSDFIGLVDELGSGLVQAWENDPDLIAPLAQAVIDAAVGVDKLIISNTASTPYSTANGIAIYLPEGAVDTDYDGTNVQLASDTSWNEFLNDFEANMGGSWVEDAANETQRFPLSGITTTDSVDLVDFCRNLLDYSPTTLTLAPTQSTGGSSTQQDTSGPQVTTQALTELPLFVESAIPIEVDNEGAAKLASGIVDNRDATADRRFSRVSGVWSTSGRIRQGFRNDYAYAVSTNGAETARARFTCGNLPAGEYEVYAWWPDGKDRAVNVPFEIHNADGVATVRVDQTRNGGTWNLLGVFKFAEGGHIVEVHNGVSQPGAYVSADAVRFVQVK